MELAAAELYECAMRYAESTATAMARGDYGGIRGICEPDNRGNGRAAVDSDHPAGGGNHIESCSRVGGGARVVLAAGVEVPGK